MRTHGKGVSASGNAPLQSSFLALMQEKKQKKIKASGMPAKLAGYLANFLAPEGAAGQVGRVLGKLPCPAGAARSEKMTYTTIEE